MSAPAVSSILFALRSEARELVEHERAEQAAQCAEDDRAAREEAHRQMVRALLAVLGDERAGALAERITLVFATCGREDERYGPYRGAVELGDHTLLFSAVAGSVAPELGLALAGPCAEGSCRQPATSPHCATWRELAHWLAGDRALVCETCRRRRTQAEAGRKQTGARPAGVAAPERSAADKLGDAILQLIRESVAPPPATSTVTTAPTRMRTSVGTVD